MNRNEIQHTTYHHNREQTVYVEFRAVHDPTDVVSRNSFPIGMLTGEPKEVRSMSTEAELEEKFWQALKSDMTMMVGIVGAGESHTRPMTAQLERDDGGPIWFFTAKDTDLVQRIRGDARAIATFASKGHELFAAVHGKLRLDTNRDVLDRLWNSYVAAWYEGGKDDPKLALLRLDPDAGQIWGDASSFMAGVRIMLGIDPKQDYKDKVAKVDLR